MAKPRFIMFDSDLEADFFESDIEDGCVSHDNKTFFVGMATPVRVKRTIKKCYDLYLLRWDSPVPSEINLVKVGVKSDSGKKTVKAIKTRQINPKFSGMQVVTPEMLKKIMDMKIFGNLIKIKTPINPVIMIVMGIAMGVLILYLLAYLKILRF